LSDKQFDAGILVNNEPARTNQPVAWVLTGLNFAIGAIFSRCKLSLECCEPLT